MRKSTNYAHQPKEAKHRPLPYRFRLRSDCAGYMVAFRADTKSYPVEYEHLSDM